MVEIAGRRALRIAQKAFKRDLTSLLRQASDRASGVLVRSARLARTTGDGTIDPRLRSHVAGEVGGIVQRVFVAGDGRSSVLDDGRAVSPYARLLLYWIAWTTREAVRGHQKYMERQLPPDVLAWLRESKKKPVQEQSEPPRHEGHQARLIQEQNQDGEEWERLVAQFLADYADIMRIFTPNPLAEVDPLRRWVRADRWTDPKGYDLSDRIWQNALRTRQKIDALITDALRTGQSALDLSRLLEQFLLPGRAPLRTDKPYGIDASYDAMRLGRTEIARAHNQAAWLSSYLNPYVETIDVSRSPWGDPLCPVCPEHATIGLSGERLRPPYPMESADIPPWHPHDMCFVVPRVADDPATVTRRLSQAMDEARELHIDPYWTPAIGDNFVEMLLGRAIYDLLKQGSALVSAGL